MKKNRSIRATIACLVAVLGVLAPAASWADTGVVSTLGSPGPRGAYILGVIEDGPGPITQIATRIEYFFGIIEDGPDPITSRSHRLGIVDERPDPITRVRPRPLTTRARPTSR